jgi:hypothetical protein
VGFKRVKNWHQISSRPRAGTLEHSVIWLFLADELPATIEPVSPDIARKGGFIGRTATNPKTGQRMREVAPSQ